MVKKIWYIDLTIVKMPKYSLDEKGILTIIDETDGGVFTVALRVKRIVLVLAIITVAVLTILYFAKYYRFTDIDYLYDVIVNNIMSLDVSSSLSMMSKKINISYPVVAVVENVKGQPGFYVDFFRIVPCKVEELFEIVRTTFQSIIS